MIAVTTMITKLQSIDRTRGKVQNKELEGTEISLGKKSTIYIYGWIGRNFWEDQVGTGKKVRRGGSGREYGERLIKLRGI